MPGRSCCSSRRTTPTRRRRRWPSSTWPRRWWSSGYDVRIVDSAVTDGLRAEAVLRRLRGRRLPGHQHGDGAHDHAGRGGGAGGARRAIPDLPIVAGGWHASILPEQTLRSPCFDAVVKGQGEVTFLEMVERYARGERDLDGHRGLPLQARAARSSGTRDRGYTDINALPRRPFHLVDFEAVRAEVRRPALDPLLHLARLPLGLLVLLERLRLRPQLEAAGARHGGGGDGGAGARATGWRWSTSSTTTTWCAATARWTSRRGCSAQAPRFAYYMQTRTDQIDRLSDDELALLARSGLRRIFFGLESGSVKVMRSVNKRLDLETAYRTAERCRAGGHPALLQPHLRPAGRGGGGPARHHGRGGPHRPGQPRGRLLHQHLLALSGLAHLAAGGRARRARAAEPGGVGGVLPQGPGAALAAGPRATPASSASATTSASATRRARWWWRRRAG